ncbi:hypothetical protein AVEN_164430-1 [Araneus ventricosus]|uniref:Uncharacterized protein n=1 Tax=Araneus ventricosus TaxID=182803 RepID=A0A4Y2AZ76_ARAVE|nr:hypothetical protein AVEN_164430-1 [Araneus ventricosus]
MHRLRPLYLCTLSKSRTKREGMELGSFPLLPLSEDPNISPSNQSLSRFEYKVVEISIVAATGSGVLPMPRQHVFEPQGGKRGCGESAFLPAEYISAFGTKLLVF